MAAINMLHYRIIGQKTILNYQFKNGKNHKVIVQWTVYDRLSLEQIREIAKSKRLKISSIYGVWISDIGYDPTFFRNHSKKGRKEWSNECLTIASFH